jgi:hypothetical protein
LEVAQQQDLRAAITAKRWRRKIPVSGVCYAARMRDTKPPRFDAGLWLSTGLVILALLVIALVAAIY